MSIPPPFWHPSLAHGFILDWDGVLADTKLDFAPIRAKYFNGERLPLVEAADRLEPSEREALERDLYDLEMEGARRATPVEGAHDLLEWLKRSRIPWAVVSRNCRDSICEAAKRCGIELPPTVLSRDEGPLKPDPQALWAAAGALGIEPGRCVMIGDFVYDLYGAKRAGMRAVLVERVVPEWQRWADLSFERLEELVRSLTCPEAFVPGEYRELVVKKGRDWLERAWALDVALPESVPGVFRIALEAARLGVGSVRVPESARLSLEQWDDAPFLSISMVDRPLGDSLAQVIRERFPQVSFSGDGSRRTLPDDPSRVEEVLISWLT
ncbi:MAG: HAD-IA family hydrolase [Thermovirgaceae bacterium]|nr:HAD-IA family hydrolase [Thermovirgaceae bacterium]